MEKLKNSIKNGFICPFIIWKNNILDGHQRKKALQQLREEGWEIPPLPVVNITAKTKSEAKGIVLDLTSQHGEFDKSKLKLYIESYKLTTLNIVLRNTPLKLKQPEKKETELEDDYKPITKKSDMWELNEHKLYCCDSDRNIDVLKTIKNYILLTDPPFEKKELNWFDLINKTNPLFIMHSDLMNAEIAVKYKKIFRYFLVHYYSFGFARSKTMPQLAHHLISVMGEQKFKSTDGFKTVICEQMEHNRLMPYQKKVEIFESIINHYGSTRDIIYDPFLGSGTMIIAAEKTGKKCYGNEIDPKICDIIVHRYYNYLQSCEKKIIFKLNNHKFDCNKLKPE
jgi:DNA modification methylase